MRGPLEHKPLAANFFQETVFEDRVEYRIANGHGERVAAEGGAVKPAVMPIAAASVARHAPIGNPPPIPLAIAMISGAIPLHS